MDSSLVVIAIIAIVAAILFPVFAQAKAAAKKTTCLSNMKQMGLTMNLYLMDSDDTFPLDSHVGLQNSWVIQIQPYTKSKLLARCPTDQSRNFDQPLPTATQVRQSTYSTNYYFSQQDRFEPSPLRGYVNYNSIAAPASTIYIAELATNYVSEHFHPGLWYEGNFEGVYVDPDKELARIWHSGTANYLHADWHAKSLVFSQTFSGNGTVDQYDPRRE